MMYCAALTPDGYCLHGDLAAKENNFAYVTKSPGLLLASGKISSSTAVVYDGAPVSRHMGHEPYSHDHRGENLSALLSMVIVYGASCDHGPVLSHES